MTFAGGTQGGDFPIAQKEAGKAHLWVPTPGPHLGPRVACPGLLRAAAGVHRAASGLMVTKPSTWLSKHRTHRGFRSDLQQGHLVFRDGIITDVVRLGPRFLSQVFLCRRDKVFRH